MTGVGRLAISGISFIGSSILLYFSYQRILKRYYCTILYKIIFCKLITNFFNPVYSFIHWVPAITLFIIFLYSVFFSQFHKYMKNWTKNIK